MKYIILGILMLRQMTVYEMRVLIMKNFKAMCSDSIGSVKAALKQLTDEGRVTYVEIVEKKVNKRVYSITSEGRSALIQWLSVPADLSKGKNVELGKLLFLGLVPEKEQAELLDQVIADLNQELAKLQQTRKELLTSEEKEQAAQCFEGNSAYFEGIKAFTKLKTVQANVESISRYQLMTLEYGIDLTKFHIAWFSQVKRDLISREEK